MTCPSESALLDLVAGRLSDPDARALDTHLDECADCRRAVAAVARTNHAAPLAAAPLALWRGTVICRYQLLDRVGVGAMGVVYAAYDVELDRKIALKLLHTDEGERARERLAREAQALARLQHPNVITLYDVGTFEGRVFLSMEFVPGGTLAAWLASAPRTPAEIVQRFVLAGRGLDAAHRAGLVHRDFKPENVLVDPDGRVCVTDFGLARAQTPAVELAPGLALTRSSVMAGTPAYMAPEQLAGRSSDARSDQFSFCVALYEALFAVRPFVASSLAELRAVHARGVPVQLPPSKPRVATAIRRALRRGLELSPEARYPSMDALLAQLEREPGRLRATLLGAAGGVVMLLALLGGVGRLRPTNESPCRGFEKKLAGVWDDPARAQLRTAFAGSHKPYAADALAAVTRTFDRYGRDWVAMRTDACEATRVRGEQSAGLLDARMQCLEDRRGELQALVGALGHGDDAAIAASARAGETLVPLSLCADARALSQRGPPPPPGAARDALGRVRPKITALRSQFQTGHFPEALTAALALEPEVRALTYRPVQAEALLLMARVADEAAQLDRARGWYNEAAWAAEAGRDDRSAADARIRLYDLVGYEQAHPADVAPLETAAAAALERVGKDAELEVTFEVSRGKIEVARGAAQPAVTHFRRALGAVDLAEVATTVRASVLDNLGTALDVAGDAKGAVAALDQAAALWLESLGPGHPALATSLSNLGLALRSTSDHARARSVLEHALAIRRAALPADHPDVGESLYNLGVVEADEGDLDQAAPRFTEALAILEKNKGADHPDVGTALVGLAMLETQRKRYDDAERDNERALGIFSRSVGVDHLSAGNVYESMGDVDVARGRLGAAVAHYRRALAIKEHALGAANANLTGTMTSLGAALERAGQLAAAAQQLERALELPVEDPGDLDRAQAKFALARVRWRSGADRARARALAEEARAAFLPPPAARAIKLLTEVDACAGRAALTGSGNASPATKAD